MIHEKIEEDPAFYTKFSKMIQQAIDDYLAKRISDMEYLQMAMDFSQKVANRVHEGLPKGLEGKEDAQAYFGVLETVLNHAVEEGESRREIAASAALAMDEILQRHSKVSFWDDQDAQNETINDLDDYLFEQVKGDMQVNLTVKEMDEMIKQVM